MCSFLSPKEFLKLLTQFDFPTTGRDSSFSVESLDSLIAPDIAAPIPITGLSQVRQIKNFEIDVATNSLKNISGRNLTMVGDMAVQFQQTGAQQCVFFVASEFSIDGINWTYNANSLRVITVDKTGVDYLSIPSLNIGDWEDGVYIRFVFSKSGQGGVTIDTPVETLGGDSVSGHSFVWTMRERP